PAGAERIAHVGEAFQVQGAGEQSPYADHQQGRQSGRVLAAGHRDHRGGAAEKEPDDGQPRQRRGKIAREGAATGRDAREERDRRDEAAQDTHYVFFSDTPAEANVAISVCTRMAASMSSMASAAPVPSPSRMPRSS